MAPDQTTPLAALLKSTRLVDDEEILEAANTALKANGDDVQSQRTRIVALLKLDRFDEALQTLQSAGEHLNSTCVLEKAYALYKTGQLEAATSLLETADVPERSLRHLAAQIAYRREDYQEAKTLYSKLLADEYDEDENDIHINLSATKAQSKTCVRELSGSASQDLEYPTFELCYNAACAYIARGSYQTALQLLSQAGTLCENSDELTEDEKKAEMQSILLQEAYIHVKLSENNAASERSQSLDQVKHIDPDIAVIAQNNRIVADSLATSNAYVTQLATQSCSTEKDAKLFQYQLDALSANLDAADLAVHKTSGVRRRTASKLRKSTHPSSQPAAASLSSINVAAITSGSHGKTFDRRLAALSRRRPLEIGLALVIVQEYFKRGQTVTALATLEDLIAGLDENGSDVARDIRYQSGLVSLRVALLRAHGRSRSAKDELRSAADYWKGRETNAANSVLREAGIELLRSWNAEDLALAGTTFEKLHAEQEDSRLVSAGLVAALAVADSQKISEQVEALPPVETLIADVDTGELLQAGVAAAPSAHFSTNAKRNLDEAGGGRPDKKRRRRKVPKDFVEGKLPDPERWLPLRDRSSYRPKGKKGKKKMAEATQGGPVKADETLDLVGGGGVKVEKLSAPNAGGSKKKKKGKK